MEIAEASKAQAVELIQLVSFRLGQEEFGVEILKVQEINRMVEITKVPQAPHYCEGVINLRGKVIPVINLRKKFNLEELEWDKSTRILVCDVDGDVVGVIVDSVEEVIKIPRSTIEPAPEIVSSIDSEYIEGIAKLEKNLLIFLNVGKVTSGVSQQVGELEEVMR
ncbi:MAG: purine-binding chemotaxis protein CheW [candidate division Zixibacteria bacterium]|nr:purine-binding chemotaxis protein CheW [candidate division Zixibacteria bacterium]